MPIPSCRLQLAGHQPLKHSVFTQLRWASPADYETTDREGEPPEVWDDSGMFDPAHPEYVTIGQDGVFRCWFDPKFWDSDANGVSRRTGRRAVAVQMNDGNRDILVSVSADPGGTTSLSAWIDLALRRGDRISVWLEQQSGAVINATGHSAKDTTFGIAWDRPLAGARNGGGGTVAELGVNVAGRAEQSPAAIAGLGAKWARCVAYPDANIVSWIQGCHAKGIKVLLVLASESIGQNANDWASGIAWYHSKYGSLVDAWQLGNESDHVSPSSWTMTQAALSELLRTGRNVLGPDAYLVGAGMADGQPDWADSVDWSPVNAFGIHPYAKDPNNPEPNQPIDVLFDGYARQGKPLWVTEYHARTIGMAAALRDDSRVSVALAFCMSDSMVPGFGLLEDRNALKDFKAAAAGQVNHPPTPHHAEFQNGFKEIADRHPEIVGLPKENESGPWKHCSLQRTTNGILVWGDFADGVGDQKGFVAEDLTRWVWNGTQLVRR